MNNWVNHVKNYSLENGIPYKKALSDAHCKECYTGGSLKTAGYIRKLLAQGKFDITKMKEKPSPYLLRKYGDTITASLNNDLNEENNVNDNVDYNVGRPKRRAKPKTGQREVDYDLQQQRNQLRQQLHEQLEGLKSLKEEYLDYDMKVGRYQTQYERQYKEIEANKKRLRFDRKMEELNKLNSVRLKFRSDAIKAYPELIQYMKSNKLSLKGAYANIRKGINDTEKQIVELIR